MPIVRTDDSRTVAVLTVAGTLALRYVETGFAKTMVGRGITCASFKNAILKASVASSAACRNASGGVWAVAFSGCAVKFKTGHEH